MIADNVVVVTALLFFFPPGLLFTAEDPAEEIVSTRNLSMLTISTYAAKQEWKASERAEMGSNSEEECSGEEELESSEPEELVRRKIQTFALA